MKKLQYIVLFSLCTIAHLSSAEETAEPTTLTHDGRWYIGAGYLGLDSDVAEPQGVGSGGLTFDLGYAGMFSNGFVYNLGAYIPLFSDEDSFTQTTKDTYGNVDDSSSSISAWGLLAEAGYGYKLNEQTMMTLSVGVRSLSADRSIGYCSDCYSENISLNGGAYLRPSLLFLNGSYNIEVSLMSFLSGDLTNGFMVGLSF